MQEKQNKKSDWVVVYRTHEMHLAMIAKALLSQNDMESVVLNKQDSMYPPLNENFSVQVLVQAEDVMRANRIIENADL